MRNIKRITKSVVCTNCVKKNFDFVAVPIYAINDDVNDKRYAIDTRGGMCDIKLFGNYAYYNAFYDAIKAGLDPRSTKANRIDKEHRSAEVQRDAKTKSCEQIQERVSGETLVGGGRVEDGAERIPFFQAWSILLNIADERLLHKDKRGNLWMLVPVNEEDFEEFLGGIEFLDGQHRVISFSDAFSLIDGIIDKYSVNVFVLLNATTHEKLMHFHSINGECKVVSTEMNYASCIAMGQKTKQEREMYSVARENAGFSVLDGDNMTVVPQMSGNINLGHQEGKISAKNICEFTCVDRNGYLREDNLPDVLRGYGYTTTQQFASVLNQYCIAWNNAFDSNFGFKGGHEKNTPNTNLFCALSNQNGEMLNRQSYSNFVWAIAPAIVSCAHKQGAITVDNMKKVICVMMHDLYNKRTLRDVYEIGSGRKTMQREAEYISERLIQKCNKSAS